MAPHTASIIPRTRAAAQREQGSQGISSGAAGRPPGSITGGAGHHAEASAIGAGTLSLAPPSPGSQATGTDNRCYPRLSLAIPPAPASSPDSPSPPSPGALIARSGAWTQWKQDTASGGLYTGSKLGRTTHRRRDQLADPAVVRGRRVVTAPRPPRASSATAQKPCLSLTAPLCRAGRGLAAFPRLLHLQVKPMLGAPKKGGASGWKRPRQKDGSTAYAVLPLPKFSVTDAP